VWSLLRASGVAKLVTVLQTEKYVVAVEVEMVIPVDDPSEPCYEAETVEFLREVKERAEGDELSWLKRHGKVYGAVGAA
jgi:predicted N-acetyltransferase YhbS